jgi:hypothetical protein
MNTQEPFFYPATLDTKAELSQMSDFPHCPNPSCPHYHCPPAGNTWFVYHGSYMTKVVGQVTRYRCTKCGRTFGYRTFHVDYYTKKTISYAELMAHVVCTAGEGNICRFHNLREDLVLNRFERLSRLLLHLHTLVRKELLSTFPETTLVLDGFESFSHSQYHPNNINILAGKEYEFIYGLGLSVLKRKGRMTRKQKLKRDILEKANKTDSKQTLNSVRNLLQGLKVAIGGEAGGRRILITDDHKTYPRSLDLVDPLRTFYSHISISSKLYRNYQNLLFVVNYLDRQIRKDSANHVRETIQFAQCPQAMMAKLTIYQVYHNCISPWRVKGWRGGDKRSRAQMMGMSSERIEALLRSVWGKRPFRGKSELWEEEQKTWDMKWENPGRPIGRYKPKYIRA